MIKTCLSNSTNITYIADEFIALEELERTKEMKHHNTKKEMNKLIVEEEE